MKKICLVFTLSVLAAGMNAHADDLIPKCNDSMYSIFGVHPGFKCETSKGKVLERVTDLGGVAFSWKNTDGVTWILADYSFSFGSRDDVVNACVYAGAELPTAGELKEIESTGLNEVLPAYSQVSDALYHVYTSDSKTSAYEANHGNFRPAFSYEAAQADVWSDRMYPLCVKKGVL